MDVFLPGSWWWWFHLRKWESTTLHWSTEFEPSILEVSTCFQAPILQWSSGMSFEESAKPFLREESSGFFCNFRMTLAHPDICIEYISLSLLVEPFNLSLAQNPWPQHHDSFTASSGKCGLDNGSAGSGTLGLAETAEAAVHFDCGDSPGVFDLLGWRDGHQMLCGQPAWPEAGIRSKDGWHVMQRSWRNEPLLIDHRH